MDASDKMKILQVVEASGAGVGRHVSLLCKGLTAHGHRVVVAYAPYRVDELFQQFVVDQREEIHFLPLRIRRRISPVSDVRALIHLVNLIRREGPFDVVHGHSSKGGAIARIVGRSLGIPTVYTPHSLIMASPEISKVEAAFYTWIERILGYLATSKLIAVSRDESDFVYELNLVPESCVVVIRNGIDAEDFEYFAVKTDTQAVHQKPLTFGAVMRFSPQKAPKHLVMAFAKLVEMAPQVPVRLVIAGDGELFPEVRRRVAATGLQEKISLLGWREDTRDVLRNCDVFVLPSLYEGFSYSILEAMAAKLPIVSTDVFGTRETVAQVPGNVVVPAGDVEALAQGMKQITTLADQESLRRSLQEIGQANYDYAWLHFRQRETISRTIETYQALCSRKVRRRLSFRKRFS